jgi:hypothetical protein
MLRTDGGQEAAEEPAQVECYAGHAYPSRPLAFTWHGQRHEVAEVVREWQEPGRRVFVVAVVGGGRFTLRYYTQADSWTAEAY